MLCIRGDGGIVGSKVFGYPLFSGSANTYVYPLPYNRVIGLRHMPTAKGNSVPRSIGVTQ